MKVFNTCIEEGSSTIYPAFDTFLNALIDSLIEKQQKEEQNLMDQWCSTIIICMAEWIIISETACSH